MCDPVTIALAAGAGLLQKKLADDAAEREMDVVNEERGRQDRFQEQARRAIEQTIPEFEPKTRADRVAEQRAAEEATAVDAIGRAREEVGAGQASGVQGDVSDAYTAKRATDVTRQIDDAIEFARLASAVRAPALAGQDEQFLMLGLGRDLGSTRAGAVRSARTADLERTAAGQVDPMGKMFADALGAAAGAGVGMPGIPMPGATAPTPTAKTSTGGNIYALPTTPITVRPLT